MMILILILILLLLYIYLLFNTYNNRIYNADNDDDGGDDYYYYYYYHYLFKLGTNIAYSSANSDLYDY